ncbi:hypothetical protein OG689_33800 [Kitasatospora sp. NBC_00240]|uniref:hypothetical protein n=1 Tax=Kitasatospora sp. NBC_00240 TaxID=2903567 RepID=UPI0022583894|nr:hypothetical protein [Kitasatospora sp. NBC_00240]MCX5214179.1 hypothetical protein [Kitasatospora sp. NBC_00240]
MHLPSDAAATAAPTAIPGGPTVPDRPHSSDAPGGRKLDGGILGLGDIVFCVVAAAAPLTVMAGVAPFAIAFGGIVASPVRPARPAPLRRPGEAAGEPRPDGAQARTSPRERPGPNIHGRRSTRDRPGPKLHARTSSRRTESHS